MVPLVTIACIEKDGMKRRVCVEKRWSPRIKVTGLFGGDNKLNVLSNGRADENAKAMLLVNDLQTGRSLSAVASDQLMESIGAVQGTCNQERSRLRAE